MKERKNERKKERKLTSSSTSWKQETQKKNVQHKWRRNGQCVYTSPSFLFKTFFFFPYLDRYQSAVRDKPCSMVTWCCCRDEVKKKK